MTHLEWILAIFREPSWSIDAFVALYDPSNRIIPSKYLTPYFIIREQKIEPIALTKDSHLSLDKLHATIYFNQIIAAWPLSDSSSMAV